MDEEAEEMLHGDALIPYQDFVRGVCWWCGAPAESREHKFKKTDLDRMSDGSGLLWGSAASSQLVPVRSNKRSNVVRFDTNLCRRCNNARSQPFDYAYDRYATHVWRHQPRLLRQQFLDMAAIFGSPWSSEVHNLARYFVKHIGCRMASDGYRPPPHFADFLEGSKCILEGLQMVLFRDLSRLRWWQRMPAAGADTPGVSIGDSYGQVSRSRNMLTAYSSVAAVGRIGVFYRWNLDEPTTDPFYSYRRARLHRRDKLPQQ